MAIGNAASVQIGGLNSKLGDCAVTLRDCMEQINALWSYVSSLGAGETAQVAALAALTGWQNSSTDPQAFWTAANYLFAMSQLYYGQIAQATTFNYDSGLASARGAS